MNKRTSRFLLVAMSLVCALGTVSCAHVTLPRSCRVGEFPAGTQAWTFHAFTAFEAIEKTAAAGGKTIEFYPDQRFSPDDPKLKLNHDLSDADIARLKAELNKYGVRAVGYGCVVGRDEADWRKIFEFAHKMGMYSITVDTTKAISDLDLIEKLVKEYNIRVGIHDHPKQKNDPNYRNWDPNFIYTQVKDRDPRIGSCADTGHWQTCGMDPLECLKELHGRVISLHLKDRTERGPGGHDVPYGTGTGEVPAILDELKSEGFHGFISVEYEYDDMNNVGQVKQCLEFLRDYRPKS